MKKDECLELEAEALAEALAKQKKQRQKRNAFVNMTGISKHLYVITWDEW